MSIYNFKNDDENWEIIQNTFEEDNVDDLVETDGDESYGAEDDVALLGNDTTQYNLSDVDTVPGIEDHDDCFKARHIFGFMGFLGFAVVYAMRVNLSVAIVAMVNQTYVSKDNISMNIIDDTCPIPASDNNNTKLPTAGEFNWDESTQGLVLGSFFYGYVLTQIPGGRLAEIMGGKAIYGYGVLITAIFTILTPIAAHMNLSALIIIRVLEGMGEGVTYPAMHAMLAHWIPPLERNKFAAIVYAGSNIGTVISMILAGWLCSLKFLGGWPLAFYIFGFMGVIWFIFWMYLVYDTPNKHPRISYKELQYIEHSIRATSNTDGTNANNSKYQNSIPWAEMLKSMPLWAILVTQCGQSWAFYTQLTELPTYMNNILHYDIESNALLNAIPQLTTWIVGIICSAIADWSLKCRLLTLSQSFKLWNTVSSVLPSLGLIGVGYVGCNRLWVTIMLAGVGSFGGATYSGNQLNHIALSPRFAGTMFGITNSAANIAGFLSPYVIGSIINHRESLTQWRKVFWLAGIMNIVCNIFYIIFCKAEELSWSKHPKTTIETKTIRT